MRASDFDRFARAHRGLISFEEAARRGIDRSEWNSAVADAEFVLLHRNVARAFGVPDAKEQRIQASVIAAGPGAMGSHRSAAFIWGADRPVDDPIDVILEQRGRRARLDDVVVHRPRDLVDLRPVVHKGIAVTDPLRTLLDLGAVDARSVPRTLNRFIVGGLVTPAGVRSMVDAHSQRGRHGIGVLRRALDNLAIDEGPVDSDLELRMAHIAKRYSLPRLEYHARVEGFEVDFLVVGSQIVIECDGWLTHGVDRNQFEFDRSRGAELTAAGFIIVHVTWRQMVHGPAGVARRIRENVRRWAPHLLAS